MKRNILVLECNKAKTFKKRIGSVQELFEKHNSPLLVDEQKRKSQDVEGSSLEHKTKMFSMKEPTNLSPAPWKTRSLGEQTASFRCEKIFNPRTLEIICTQ